MRNCNELLSTKMSVQMGKLYIGQMRFVNMPYRFVVAVDQRLDSATNGLQVVGQPPSHFKIHP